MFLHRSRLRYSNLQRFKSNDHCSWYLVARIGPFVDLGHISEEKEVAVPKASLQFTLPSESGYYKLQQGLSWNRRRLSSAWSDGHA
jgi:hypothetical protein